MKIAILAPRNEFSLNQLKRLRQVGQLVFVPQRKSYPFSEIKNLVQGSQILAVDPDILGGFEKAKSRINSLIEFLPTLKGIALNTTSMEYVDLQYCCEKGIAVTNVPGYATQAVAEHTIGLIIGLAKRIFLHDRQIQSGVCNPELGFELKGKTLGIIGLGRIGSKVAQLACCLELDVVAFNRTPRSMRGVKMVSLNYLYNYSDIISLHLAAVPETYSFIDKDALSEMKKGVIVVNLASRLLVDEKAMADAIRNGEVDSYAYEGDDLTSGPLAGISRAFGFKAFGWYTKESLARATEIWTQKILWLAQSSATENRR